jgi:hypothetical protein
MDGTLKIDLQGAMQVFALLGRLRHRPFTDLAEALKDILKTIETAVFFPSLFQAFLPEKVGRRKLNPHPIVSFPSRFIRKNLISFQDLSETKLCSFISRRGGKLISAGQPLVCPLDLLVGSPSPNSQNVVIIFS